MLRELSSDRALDGRSAVLRRAAAENLAHRTQQSIAEQYRRVYGTGETPHRELAGWDSEGHWPDEIADEH